MDVQLTFADADGKETLHATASLSGTVSPSLGGSCALTAATLHVNSGTLSVQWPDGTQLGTSFAGTTVGISNITFNPNCVPTAYHLTFSGPASLLTPAGATVAVTFDNLVMNVDDTSDPTVLDLSGGMSSTCFGGAGAVTTEAPLRIHSGSACPFDGTISATVQSDTTRIFYRSDQSGAVDEHADGSTDATATNCLDARLLMCLG